MSNECRLRVYDPVMKCRLGVVGGDRQLFEVKEWQYNIDLEEMPYQEYDPETLWLKLLVYDPNDNYDLSDMTKLPFTVIKSNYNQLVSDLEQQIS